MSVVVERGKILKQSGFRILNRLCLTGAPIDISLIGKIELFENTDEIT